MNCPCGASTSTSMLHTPLRPKLLYQPPRGVADGGRSNCLVCLTGGCHGATPNYLCRQHLHAANLPGLSFNSSWRRQPLHTPYNKLNGGAGCTKQNTGQFHMECGVRCTATVEIANSLSTDLKTHSPPLFVRPASVVARLSAGPLSARWPYDWFIGSRSPKGETLSPRPLPATGIMIICFR